MGVGVVVACPDNPFFVVFACFCCVSKSVERKRVRVLCGHVGDHVCIFILLFFPLFCACGLATLVTASASAAHNEAAEISRDGWCLMHSPSQAFWWPSCGARDPPPPAPTDCYILRGITNRPVCRFAAGDFVYFARRCFGPSS